MNLNKLRAKRAELGLTQLEIANKLGINPVTYQRKETGVREFSINEAIGLSSILNLTLDEANSIFFDNKLTNRLIIRKETETA